MRGKKLEANNTDLDWLLFLSNDYKEHISGRDKISWRHIFETLPLPEFDVRKLIILGLAQIDHKHMFFLDKKCSMNVLGKNHYVLSRWH